MQTGGRSFVFPYNINYRPRSVASEGYVFTGICHSVTKLGGCDTKCIMG